MVPDKIATRLAGLFYITATAAPMLTYILGEHLIAPDYLVAVSTNENLTLGVVLIEILWVFAVVGIPVMLYPLLKSHDETLTLGWLGLRLIEAACTAIGTLLLLTLLTLSHEFVHAGSPTGSPYQILGTLLLATRDWTLWLTLTIFSPSALILNYLLYRSKQIPRWLSAWGLLGGVALVTSQLLDLLSIDLMILNFPIMVQEMVFAVWLIAKGLKAPTIATQPA